MPVALLSAGQQREHRLGAASDAEPQARPRQKLELSTNRIVSCTHSEV